MAENLNVDNFRNGDNIPQAITDEEWEKAARNEKPAWCYYNNDPKNGKKYGKLYNWYAVNDPRGLAPKGWKIPSNNDWKCLINFLGGESEAIKKMKSTSGWAYHNGRSGGGTNASGFSGLPGGWRDFDDSFCDFGEDGLWWSSSEFNHEYAWSCQLSFMVRDWDKGEIISETNKISGFSVRCLRD
jgi:uncharacterized protein (TIGR02145 family)